MSWTGNARDEEEDEVKALLFRAQSALGLEWVLGRRGRGNRLQVSGLGDTVDKKAAAERWLQWVESFRGNKDVCFLFLDMLSLRGLQDIQVATYSKGNSSFNFIQRRLRRIH